MRYVIVSIFKVEFFVFLLARLVMSIDTMSGN